VLLPQIRVLSSSESTSSHEAKELKPFELLTTELTLSRIRQSAYLRHQSDHICLSPPLDNLAPYNSYDIYSAHTNLVSSSRYAHKIAAVNAGLKMMLPILNIFNLRVIVAEHLHLLIHLKAKRDHLTDISMAETSAAPAINMLVQPKVMDMCQLMLPMFSS
jgi:hypothetical protein